MMRSCPVFVDWNRDGKFDLVLGVLNANGIWPDHREFRLYLNKGTNDEPKFDDFTPARRRDRQTAEAARVVAQDGRSPVRRGPARPQRRRQSLRPGRRDSEPRGGLRLTRTSRRIRREPRFKFVKLLGDPTPIDYPTSYRYFYCGDVDGDGIPDVINCNAEMIFFKGLPAKSAEPVARGDQRR